MDGVAKGFSTDIDDVTGEEQAIVERNKQTFTVDECNTFFDLYRNGKVNLDNRLKENDTWYKNQHMKYLKTGDKSDLASPVTALLFATIRSLHADIMDNYPTATFEADHEDDEEEEVKLTSIVPKILKKCKHRKIYSDVAWYKLKHGCGVTGYFWNPKKANCIGDVDIKKCDLLNLYWMPGIEDIEKSPRLFYGMPVDNDILQAKFPALKKGIGSGQDLIKVYDTGDNIDTTNMSYVIDMYHKKLNSKGETVTHLFTYTGETVLFDSASDPQYKETGYYEHGQYPFKFDVLFPIDGTPIGFGFVDILRNPQAYIDELDGIITDNAFEVGHTRYLMREDLQINENDFADLKKRLVHTKGSPKEGESYARLVTAPLDQSIMVHRANKIAEFKEVSGDTDFNKGGTGKTGVTAAGAIYALQQAAQKCVRDMVGMGYMSFEEGMYLIQSIIAQFYEADHTFRIKNPETGTNEYIPYNNAGLRPKPLDFVAADEEGSMPQFDDNGEMIPHPEAEMRRPTFDITIKAERENPFSTVANNQLATDMFKLGVFNPQNALAAKVLLEMMKFDDKDKLLKLIDANDQTMQQMQQLQQQNLQMQQILGQIQSQMPAPEQQPNVDPNAGAMPGGI